MTVMLTDSSALFDAGGATREILFASEVESNVMERAWSPEISMLKSPLYADV